MLKHYTKRIINEIEEYCQDNLSEQGHRHHMGASAIGNKCLRKTWYQFRWVYLKRFDGRMMRLFQRGHREEPALVSYLRGIGFQVWDVDENGNQFRIQTESGHGGGSCDGVCILPPDYEFPHKCLLELKTHKDSGFKNLVRYGVKKQKPEHWAQMNMYGHGLGLLYGLYICANKNNDELHIELVELDPIYGESLFKLAESLVESPKPPERISNTPTSYVCRFCDFSGVCHDGEPFDLNCRTCQHSVPIKNKTWFCQKWDKDIPKNAQSKGCGAWEQIPNV